MEVLTAGRSGETVGYRLAGMRYGPDVVVAVASHLMEPLTDRLAAVPTLPWMRGALEMVDLDAVADAAGRPTRPIDAHPGGELAQAARVSACVPPVQAPARTNFCG